MPRLDELTLRPQPGTLAAVARIDGTDHEIEVRRNGRGGFTVRWAKDCPLPPSTRNRIERPIIRAAASWLDLAGDWP